jgi:hypothetical protein
VPPCGFGLCLIRREAGPWSSERRWRR